MQGSHVADNKLAETLAKFTPVNALNPDNLTDLAQKASVKELQAGYTLFKSGDRDKRHVFLVKGSVELASERGVQKTIYGGTPDASHALAHAQPRNFTAKATSDVVYIEVDSDLLDIMLTWDQTGTYEVQDLQEQATQESSSGDWMTHILATKAFHRIPPANIQAMFMRLESVSYASGDKVIEQGQEGDYFYLIKDGRCIVTRSAKAKPQPVQLAELGPGDSFGEEALISDGKRNATVTMLTNGTMMRLSKDDFMSLLNEPLLNWVSFSEAVEKHQQGAVWIDVRLPSEGEQGRIKGSINIPLIFLRMKIGSLDSKKSYITYCDTGRRSSAASFLLSERGFDVYILKDGISAAPAAALETGK
jgi:CRP-like cAMP-binding protein